MFPTSGNRKDLFCQPCEQLTAPRVGPPPIKKEHQLFSTSNRGGFGGASDVTNAMNTDDKPKTAALGKKVVKTEGSSDDDSDFTHAVNVEDDPTTTKEKSDEPLRGDAIVKKKDNPDEDSDFAYTVQAENKPEITGAVSKMAKKESNTDEDSDVTCSVKAEDELQIDFTEGGSHRL